MFMGRKSKYEIEVDTRIENLKLLKEKIIDKMRDESKVLGMFSLETQLELIKVNTNLQLLYSIQDTVKSYNHKDECKLG